MKTYFKGPCNDEMLGDACFIVHCEPGSSVSTVSDYGLDGRGLIRDRGRGFFL
jgi:hypothetical protein